MEQYKQIEDQFTEYREPLVRSEEETPPTVEDLFQPDRLCLQILNALRSA